MSLSAPQLNPAPNPNHRTRLNFILIILALGLLYLLLAWASFFFSEKPISLPSIWLPSGLAVGALLLDRRRAWKQILVAIFIGGVIANLLGGMPLLVSLGYGAADCIEASLLVWLLLRYLPSDPDFERLRDVLVFFGYSLASLALTGLVGTFIKILAFHSSIWQTWLEWLMTDWLGILLFTPLILVWRVKPALHFPRLREGVLLGFLLVLSICLVFFSPNAWINASPLGSYVFFALFIWAALRFDQRLSTSLLALVGIAALMGTTWGTGEFSYPAVDPASRILSTQVFITVLTFTSLVLGALLSERRRAEESYKAQFKNLPLASFTWQRVGGDFKLIDYNDAALDFTHNQVSNLLGQSARELYSTRPGTLADMAECYRTRAIVRSSARWDLLSSGETRDLNITYVFVKPDLVIGHVEDVSERLEAEQALHASEGRFRALFENASMAIFQVTLDGRPLAVNPEFLRMFGYDSWDEFRTLIQNTAELFADPGRREEILRLRAADPQTSQFESRYRRKDGSTFTGQLSMRAVTDEAGQVQYLDGFIENISERKQFEEALRASEALYHAMFDTTSAVKLLIEPASGMIVRANPPAAAFYGYPVEQLEQMNINQLNTLADEQLKNEMQAAAEQRRTFFNFQHRLATGEVRDVEVYSGPLEMGGRMLLHSIIHDVTARKQAERIQLARTRLLEFSQDHSLSELLTASVDEVENLTGSLIGFYHLIDPDQLTISIYNWSTRTLNGYCKAEGFVSHAPIGNAGVWADAVRQREPVIHNDYNALPADQRKGLPVGHAALVRELVVPVLRGGRVVCILGIGNKDTDYNEEDVQAVSQLADLAWDIAERKQAEEELAHNRALLNDSQTIARVGGWEYDIATRKAFWTEEVYQIYGLDHHKEPYDIPASVAAYAPEDRLQIDMAFQRALETGQPYDLELRFDNARGQRLWVRTNARAVYREGGMVKLTGVIMDITERKQAELALLAARDELEQRVQERTSDLQAANTALEHALQSRDEFLAAMSHELRTPLAGVLGLAQVMQLKTYGPLTDKQEFALQNIELSGQRLLELINDILDYSLAQSGALTPFMSSCRLDEICRDCLKAVSVEAGKKNLTTDFKSSPADLALRADARLLAKAIRHLLGNASKFTPEGGSFGMELTGSEAAGEVNLTVWDTGIGIQAEDLPRLFKPFVQLDARLQRQYGGTGLGLALVKQLAELHGGRVSVESEFGLGSRFTISLPWEK